MKKIYLQPSQKAIELELDSLIAESPYPNPYSLVDTPAGNNDGDITDANTGGGDGLSRQGSLWDSEW